jgi:two-component system, chemotaxis family, CheB/CheR fusion protein
MTTDDADAVDVTGPAGDLGQLIEFLRLHRGVDLTAYKRNALDRRLRTRFDVVGANSYGAYRDYLEVHPEEFTSLFDAILINVTEFFRDASAWRVISERVVPDIVAGKADDDPIRVWSVGCSTGQEPYTLAMILAEHLGTEEFRRRVKIYATDIDEEALHTARTAEFTSREVQSVPPPLLERWFERDGTRYQFSKELRRSVIFGRHDVVHDAPISRIDLLACRNTLIYFNYEAQLQVLERFHFSVAPRGFLFLGRAERLVNHASFFDAVDTRARILVKAPRLSHEAPAPVRARHGPAPASPTYQEALAAAFDAVPSALLLVDGQGDVVHCNRAAGKTFGIDGEIVGHPVRDVDLPVRSSEVRGALREAMREQTVVRIADVEQRRPEEPLRRFELAFVPVVADGGQVLGAVLCFDEVTEFRRVQEELEDANRDIALAYEELQSTNEELETTNEELQSTVEELETTNEELQSTNEELETLNEELHSANEELHTTNEELRVRRNELNHLNEFMRTVLASLDPAVVVLDRDLRVLVWSERAADLWGLHETETLGRGLLSLDFGLPLDDVVQAIRNLMRGEVHTEQLVVDAVNRRGRSFRCGLTLTRMANHGLDLQGAVMSMEEAPA